ncbi:hypothetical protein ASC66_08600 [Leifsonia sp. Root4]|uniref:hypothetical protein n=1 Tax=Leifsonia sp. Root4 TaxID=1736525 RepID=UPI000700E93D|nr:hypothetical protein [Leifsonia sp. Root4]KQW06519.1 hypothetical protein ASC66_08600 [Leifsonia sp. Root4]
MHRAYGVIAWIIAGGVAVQAAAIAFGVGGMVHFVQDGGVVDKALIESGQVTYLGEIGFWIHAIGGAVVIPLAAVILLLLSFGVRVRGARMLAAIVLGLVALQVMAGFGLRDLPYLGLLHGVNALAVLLASVYAALRVSRSSRKTIEKATSDAVPA